MTTRDEDYADPEPHWKIQISQLECQTTSTNWWKIKDIARQFWDWEEMERDSDGGSKTYSLGEYCLIVIRSNAPVPFTLPVVQRPTDVCNISPTKPVRSRVSTTTKEWDIIWAI